MNRRTDRAVTIWHARTDDVFRSDAVRERARMWLTPAEQERYGRYRQQRDRDMFLLGRAMARTLVGEALGVGPCEWIWREGPRGRPEVDADVSFNIAHTAGLVMCALSPIGHVGVDVEHRRRAPVDPRMIRRYCAPDEADDIERQPADDRQDHFLKYWTLKEAYLKARGLGITVHLADLSFTLDEPIRLERLNGFEDELEWAFVLHAPDDAHVVAAAAPVTGGVRPSFRFAPFPAARLP